ncbi:MAG TPA: periplasmic heavy metal sensor [Methylomirabilota bacterium]|nr:periplasmic heavy metal sensor [Methylomirabilota bacterium]
MKKRISNSAWLAGLLAASVLSGSTTFAADDAPPPTQPAQPAVPDSNAPAAGRGNRTRGANAEIGNVQGGRARNFNFGGLNLDEKQNELLRAAMQADNDEVRQLTEKLQAAQKELVKTIIADKYDEKIVREKADAVAKIQTDITVLRAKAFATVSPTLKPEQRDQIENSRGAVGFITGTAIGFGGGNAGPGRPEFQPQDGQGPRERAERAPRRNDNNGGDPGQNRRRGGNNPGAPGQ